MDFQRRRGAPESEKLAGSRGRAAEFEMRLPVCLDQKMVRTRWLGGVGCAGAGLSQIQDECRDVNLTVANAAAEDIVELNRHGEME